MEEEKQSIYKNPVMETYEVEGQMDIFAYLPKEPKKEIPFELCMNPPID